jgi:hypothetical protein
MLLRVATFAENEASAGAVVTALVGGTATDTGTVMVVVVPFCTDDIVPTVTDWAPANVEAKRTSAPSLSLYIGTNSLETTE